MTNSFCTHLSKFISLSAKTGGLAALIWAAAINGTSVRAQQAATDGAIQPLPAVSDDSITTVGYQDVEADNRLSDLEAAIAQQQAQIQAQNAQVQALTAQLQSGSSIDGGAQSVPATATPGAPQPSDSANVKIKGESKSTKPYVIGSDRSLLGAWTNDGPYFTSPNKDFTFHPRFVSQLDFVGVKNPAANIGVPGGNSAGTLDSVDFRRLRVGADGTMWDTVDYVMEFDYAFALVNTEPTVGSLQTTGLRNTGTGNSNGGTVPGTQGGNVTNAIQPTTTFLTFKEMPVVGNTRIGWQQDWISAEHIESARFLDFMERSPLMDAFYGPNNNGYDPGISMFRNFADNNIGVQMGAYKSAYYDSGFPYDIGNNNYTAGGRVHWTPYYDEASGGRYLVHLGCGAEFRHFNTQLNGNMNGDNVRIRARGDVRNTDSVLGPNFADTGNFYATGQNVIDPEFAVQLGSLLIRGEYTYCAMQNAATNQGGTSLGAVDFKGGYVSALYFLTGENRTYNRTSGVFGRTIPNSQGYLVKGAGFGKGAWQAGARYDWLDLNSGGVSGGQLQNMTLGLNWWINPNARFQINYVLAHVNSAAGPLANGVTGSLAGSKFTGEGCISMIGMRQDFSF